MENNNMNKSNKNKFKKIKNKFKKIIQYISIVLEIVLILAGVSYITYATNFNDHYVTITVTDKGIKTSKNGDNVTSKYLVYGEKSNGVVETYEITDNWLRGQFDSSNKYGTLQIGYKYKIKVVGYRVAFCSTYENIIGIQSSE